MASSRVVTLTDANFDSEVAQSSQPVLVDFWAEWCSPCKMLAPILDEIADERAGSMKIGKVNVDQNSGLSARFSVRSLPTLILFKDGEVMEQVVGSASKRELISKLEALV